MNIKKGLRTTLHKIFTVLASILLISMKSFALVIPSFGGENNYDHLKFKNPQFIIAKDQTKMMKNPSHDSVSSNKLGKGTLVENLFKKSNDWRLIQHDNLHGWILDSTLYPPSLSHSFDYSSIINSSHVNLRETPHLTSSIIKSLPQYTKLMVITEIYKQNNNSWKLISFENNVNHKHHNGWVYSKYVSDVPKFKQNPTVKIDYIDNPAVRTRGLYLNINQIHPQKINKFIELKRKTSINSFVIDIKNANGEIAFAHKTNQFEELTSDQPSQKNLIKTILELKKEGIYLIGRIVVFKDKDFLKKYPSYRFQKDINKNSMWVNPYQEDYWDYVLSIAKKAASIGFHEIQFDYIRFPIGPKSIPNEIKLKREETLNKFLDKARKVLQPLSCYISADVFGITGVINEKTTIGQNWKQISSRVDYISPMIYPSHFHNGFKNIEFPDQSPNQLISSVLKDSVLMNLEVKNAAIIRPWIQGFTAYWLKNHRTYRALEVQEQIKALTERNIDEYLIWSPQSYYHHLLSSESDLGPL